MCLGELARVVTVGPGPTALVRSSGREVTVSLLTLDEPVQAQDWLLVHAGFALSRLDDAQARDALALRSWPTAGSDVPEGGDG